MASLGLDKTVSPGLGQSSYSAPLTYHRYELNHEVLLSPDTAENPFDPTLGLATKKSRAYYCDATTPPTVADPVPLHPLPP